MRAAEPVENSDSADVVRIDRSAHPHHPQPVYAGSDDDATSRTLSFDVDLRTWPAQCAQWLIVFAFLGLLVGGAKWWDSWQGAAPDMFVASSGLTVPTPRRVTEAVATDPTPSASDSPAAAAMTAPTSDPSGIAAGGSTRLPVAARGGGKQSAPGSAAQAVRAPRVRAPAEVPYPRRIHDVQPQMPSNAAAARGIAVLSLLIDTEGNVAEVEILRSLDPALDAAAIDAALQWKFEPTMRQGGLVAVRGNFTVTFGY